MKRLSMAFFLAGALLLAACADPVEQRTTGEVEGQFERGVTGKGKLGPIDRSPGDQAGEHGVPQDHP